MAAAKTKAFWTGAFRNVRAKYHHRTCKDLRGSQGAEAKCKKYESRAMKKEGSGERKVE